MICGCNTYICLQAVFNPCSEGVQLDVVSTETGDWSGVIYFNGMPTDFVFGVVEDQNIILPVSLFNEFYTHEMQLWNSAGTLVGCYRVNARASMNAGTYAPIPPDTLQQILDDIAEINEELESVLRSVIYTVTAQNVTDGTFTMPVSGNLETISADYQDISAPNFTQGGNVITLPNMYEGQTLTLIYKPT